MQEVAVPPESGRDVGMVWSSHTPTWILNRPGFPGDSIGWEIMESWED